MSAAQAAGAGHPAPSADAETARRERWCNRVAALPLKGWASSVADEFRRALMAGEDEVAAFVREEATAALQRAEKAETDRAAEEAANRLAERSVQDIYELALAEVKERAEKAEGVLERARHYAASLPDRPDFEQVKRDLGRIVDSDEPGTTPRG